MKRAAFVCAVFLSACGAFGGGEEHPHEEHPEGAEHPEAQANALTPQTLADAIRAYVERESALKGGYFLHYDAEKEKPLALTLERVHDDRLARLADGSYFACADFRDRDGTAYDLDIFLAPDASGELRATAVSVHKENGVARYGWRKTEDGLWEKVPAE